MTNLNQSRQRGISVLEPLGMAQARNLIRFKTYPFTRGSVHQVLVRVQFLVRVSQTQRDLLDHYIQTNYDTRNNKFRGLHHQIYEFEFIEA